MARKLAYVVYQSHLGPDVTDAAADRYARRLDKALRKAFPQEEVEVEVRRRVQGVGSGLQGADEFSSLECDRIHAIAENVEV